MKKTLTRKKSVSKKIKRPKKIKSSINAQTEASDELGRFGKLGQEDEALVQNTCFRNLTPLEAKKIKRISAEDLKIEKIHPEIFSNTRIYLENLGQIEAVSHPPGITKLLDYQLYGLGWMINRENSSIKGGILADEMGMGKTLTTISLLVSANQGGLNIVITPAISLFQWISEFKKHAPGLFNILEYYGSKKKGITDFVLDPKKCNVLMSTYGTVSADYRRDRVLCNYSFERIILDEAHFIKDGNTHISSAVNKLTGLYRWALTGTPVQNRVSDLQNLVKFLQIDPHSFYFCKRCPCKSKFWLNYDIKVQTGNASVRRGTCTCGHVSGSHFNWWNRNISTPIKELGFTTTMGKEVFNRLSRITSHIILRRTKLAIEKELGLPSKVIKLRKVSFTQDESIFYTNLFAETKSEFSRFAIEGQVSSNYAHIFDLLHKMRLAANHPFLVYAKSSVPICGICNQEADDPIQSACKHCFCRNEAIDYFTKNRQCPVCLVEITIDLNQVFNSASISRTKIFSNNWKSSTKIECLMEELHMLNMPNNTVKCIVFSQFVDFLEMLRWRMAKSGYKCANIYGSMPLNQRYKAIDSFNEGNDVNILLISLKAGGVALNLTEASHVFIMDLWWNPAVEEQAMDRIHRIGQHRPVVIKRIVVQDSIESKILELQKKKKALFETSVDNNFSALERLTESDLLFLFN